MTPKKNDLTPQKAMMTNYEHYDTCDKAKLRWVCEEYMGPDKKCNVDIITKHTKVEEAKKKGV